MCKILVIDDSAEILEIVQEILSYEGYQVEALTACADILDAARKCKPGLVIMDYLLKGETGGELCRKIKENATTRHIPVLLYSAYPNIRKSLDHFGCDDFMAKPFDITELIAKVKNLLYPAPTSFNP